jgi:hypothetical protein
MKQLEGDSADDYLTGAHIGQTATPVHGCSGDVPSGEGPAFYRQCLRAAPHCTHRRRDAGAADSTYKDLDIFECFHRTAIFNH